MSEATVRAVMEMYADAEGIIFTEDQLRAMETMIERTPLPKDPTAAAMAMIFCVKTVTGRLMQFTDTMDYIGEASGE